MQDLAEGFAKRMGFKKGESDKTSVEFISDIFGGLADKFLPELIQMGKTKMAQQQQFATQTPPNPEFQDSPQSQSDLVHTPGAEPSFSSAPSPSSEFSKNPDSLGEEGQHSGHLSNHPVSPPQIREPTDRELMQNPALHNPSKPNLNYGDSSILDQYLGVNKFSVSNLKKKK